MEKLDPRQTAGQLLVTLIEHQPNLFGYAQGPDRHSAQAAAQFCATFIDTYAEYLRAQSR
jgi:hypothetical protein